VCSSRYFKIRMQLVCPAYAVSVGLQLGMRLDALLVPHQVIFRQSEPLASQRCTFQSVFPPLIIP
jgi:hypothetical protein